MTSSTDEQAPNPRGERERRPGIACSRDCAESNVLAENILREFSRACQICALRVERSGRHWRRSEGKFHSLPGLDLKLTLHFRAQARTRTSTETHAHTHAHTHTHTHTHLHLNSLCTPGRKHRTRTPTHAHIPHTTHTHTTVARSGSQLPTRTCTHSTLPSSIETLQVPPEIITSLRAQTES